jgi:hypothetical protein
MKYIVIIGLCSLPFLFGINSCYYDKESQLYPYSSNCDTVSVTYSITVRTILQNAGCLGCHTSPAVSGGNIVLDNYNDVKTIAQSGRLYGAINQNPGYKPMPQNGGKLTKCDISKIKKWIDLGTVNN